MTCICKRFEERVTSVTLWPPRSPDQDPRDFLWGFLKDIMYKNLPTTLVELKIEIEMATRSMDKNMLRNVFKNLLRMNACLDINGGHSNIQSWTKVSGQPRKNSITVGKKKEKRFIEK